MTHDNGAYVKLSHPVSEPGWHAIVTTLDAQRGTDKCGRCGMSHAPGDRVWWSQKEEVILCGWPRDCYRFGNAR